MERFSQFRDKGTSIAPFLPIPTEASGIYLPFHIFLFAVRIPLLFAFILSYYFFLQWLPIGALGKKMSLWCILGTPGIWWIDLQIDGVKKGSLARNNSRLPQGGSIIASSCASPIDALYLAAIFDPMFTASYPSTRQIEHISLFKAVWRAFSSPSVTPPANAKMIDLETLVARNPNRVIVVFPECTTSNGRGILPFNQSLLAAPPKAKIFPVSLRYTAPDVTTPIPHAYLTFLWNLCSKPTHCIRIRIAEAVISPATRQKDSAKTSSYTTNFFDQMEASDRTSDEDTLVGSEDADGAMTMEERAFLDRIAEALARLGRVKRVGLGVKDKIDFVAMWTKTRR